MLVSGDSDLYSPKSRQTFMTIRFVEDIYCDFLYDCYIANQRLTLEEWEFFGKETHHLWIPNCEGGKLTRLNSQDLTTYQHWIAGILQSEIWQRRCFAFVPAGLLPGMFETLRSKWAKEIYKPTTYSHRLTLIANGSIEKMREVGKVQVTNQKGIHDPSKREDFARLGGESQGRNNVVNKTGMYKRTPEELSQQSKKNRSRRFRCLVTGKVSNDTGLTKIQRRLGIDTSLREQIY